MANDVSRGWGLLMTEGIFAALVGAALIFSPDKSLYWLTLLVGFIVLLQGFIGVFRGFAGIKSNPYWWLVLIGGILGILFGGTILAYPEATVRFVVFLFALWVLVSGIVFLVQSIRMRKDGFGSGFLTALAVVQLLFGAFLFFNPVGSVSLIVIMIGIFVLIAGILTIGTSLELKRA